MPNLHPRFVVPEQVTLPISRGESLTIKKRLNAGEQRAVHQRMYYAGLGGDTRIRPGEYGLQTVLGYLLEWTVKDAYGQPVPYGTLATLEEKTDTLNALDGEDFGEIVRAINAHEERMAAERTQEKKDLAGAPASPATFTSPLDSAGVSTGSAS